VIGFDVDIGAVAVRDAVRLQVWSELQESRGWGERAGAAQSPKALCTCVARTCVCTGCTFRKSIASLRSAAMTPLVAFRSVVVSAGWHAIAPENLMGTRTWCCRSKTADVSGVGDREGDGATELQ